MAAAAKSVAKAEKEAEKELLRAADASRKCKRKLPRRLQPRLRDWPKRSRRRILSLCVRQTLAEKRLSELPRFMSNKGILFWNQPIEEGAVSDQSGLGFWACLQLSAFFVSLSSSR